MHPLTHGIPTYSFFYLGAILVYGAVAYVFAKKLGLGHAVWLVQTGCYAFGMIVGAKALFDVGHHQLRFTDVLSIRHYMEGGLWGGPLVVLAMGALFALAKKKRASALDLLALSLPPALCVAHVGCFLQGCCYGRPTSVPWAVTFPNGGPAAPGGIPVHPTQLYETAVLAVTFAVLVALANKPKWNGLLLGVFLAMYCAGRALIECFRGDERLTYTGWSVSQVICLATALLAAVAVGAKLARRRPRLT